MSFKEKILSYQKSDWVLITIALNLMAQLSLSPRLWGDGNRYFPKVNLFENLDFDVNFLIIIVISLIAFIFFFQKKYTSIVIVCLFFFAIVLDINRLQVWVWQQLLMLLFGCYLFSSRDRTRYLQWIILAVYFWSGFHKLNPLFATNTFKWFVEQSFLKSLGEIPALGYASACVEILIPILFLISKTRRFGFYLSIIFHVFILACLSPISQNWNQVVWPWNVAMVVWNYLLFFKNEDNIFVLPSEWKPKLAAYSLIFVLAVCPILQYFQLFDEQLSFKMYSGDGIEATLCLEPRDAQLLPEFIRSEVYVPEQDSLSENIRVVLDDWAFAELKVPPYYNDFSIKKIVAFYCRRAEYKEQCKMEVLRYKSFEGFKEENLVFRCEK